MNPRNTKVRRAWNNRLEGINNLLSWLYETDVLNKGEKGKKDSIFRQYYRYYNDGDTPRGVLTKYKIPGHASDLVEKYLEQYVEDFICTILNKYKGKFDKKAYLTFRKNANIEHVANRLEWGYVPERISVIKDEDLVAKIEVYVERKDAFREALVAKNPKLSSYVLSYIIENSEPSEDDLDEFAVLESRKVRLTKAVRDLKI